MNPQLSWKEFSGISNLHSSLTPKYKHFINNEIRLPEKSILRYNYDKLRKQFESQTNIYSRMFVDASNEWIIINSSNIFDGGRRYNVLFHLPTLTQTSFGNKQASREILLVEEYCNNEEGYNYDHTGKKIEFVNCCTDYSFNLSCIRYIDFDFLFRDKDDVLSWDNHEYIEHNAKFQLLLSSKRADELVRMLSPHSFLPAVILILILDYGWGPIIKIKEKRELGEIVSITNFY